MRFLSGVLFLMLLAVPAAAQPWFARGEFNGWTTDNPMIVDPNDATHFTANVSGLFDNEPFNWKIAVEDWSVSMPTTDGRVHSDALGEINFHLWDQTSWSDGWFPNDVRRVGYEDHQQFDWEVAGDFNAFGNGAHDPNFFLTDMGNGLHRGVFALDAGIYDFKFRGVLPEPVDVWDTSIGNNFGNTAGNNTIAVGTNGDEWIFELDLPNGRWRAFTEAAPPVQVGDYNGNGIVDAADYTRWRDNLGTSNVLPGDPVGGVIGQQQFDNWKTNFGQGQAVQWLARSTQLGDQTLTDLGGGQFELNMTGLAAETDFEFKVVRSDLSASVPGSNMKVRADANGEIQLNFFELESGSWTDGWSPASTHRVGYVDHDLFDWELIGDFTGWGSDPLAAMIDQGGGLHTVDFTFASAGNIQFKFRQQGDWNTSIGDDFGNSANNNSLAVGAGELWHFELDLPNGRWRAFLDVAGAAATAVPEPGSLAIVLAGLLVCMAGSRRRVSL